MKYVCYLVSDHETPIMKPQWVSTVKLNPNSSILQEPTEPQESDRSGTVRLQGRN